MQDPLDENHYDYNELLPAVAIKMEDTECNNDDDEYNNIKLDNDIVNEKNSHTKVTLEIEEVEYDKENSSDEDYEVLS